MKIFFGDLIHNWEKISVWTVPMNVGLIAAYAQKMLPGIDVRIFKLPDELINAVKKESPDVVALSYYVWNTKLNSLLFKIAKEVNPHVLTVGGGPVFTDMNSNEEYAREFYTDQIHCDAYVLQQGERGFVDLINRFSELGNDVQKLRGELIPGIIVNDLTRNDRVQVSEPLAPLKDLDEIPSPYLTGLMDPFLNDKYVPLLETNRNCPYQCTFCYFGRGGSKVGKFNHDRVLGNSRIWLSAQVQIT